MKLTQVVSVSTSLQFSRTCAEVENLCTRSPFSTMEALHMKRYPAILVLFTLFAFGADKPTAKDTIWVGIDLQLGLSKQVVMSQLAENYKLVKMEGDNWLVESKNPPVVSYGQVEFENGKLTGAARRWANGDEDSFAFAQSLDVPLSSSARRTGTFVMCKRIFRTPAAEMRSISLVCGAKRIVINITASLANSKERQRPSTSG